MNVMYKCSFCGKIYEWYGGLYENEKYSFDEKRKAERKGEEYNEDSGVLINANAFVLKRFAPLPEYEGEEMEVDEADGNLEGAVINLCPDCMRKLLDNIKINDEPPWDYV